MKNYEKYKTPEERAKAFEEYCKGHPCTIFPCKKWACAFEWLDLEVEVERPLPCPFCGSDTEFGMGWGKDRVVCANPHCWYSSALYSTKEEAAKEHNRVARAAMKAKEEAK